MTDLRALTMLNQLGDVTIAWTAERDAEMAEIIRAKMKAGVTFFIIKPRLTPADFPQRDKALKRPGDAHRHRALLIADADLGKFVSDGAGEAVKTPVAPVKGTRISRDAAEVARSQSVGVKPLRGG